jgi:hypothetical protein
VIVLENQMAGVFDAAVIEREAEAIAGMLDEARPLVASASPSAAAGDVCAYPLGAVTNQSLTDERIATVVQTYREVARDAATVPIDQIRATFGGDPHNITHDIDGPLRRADPELALELCRSVFAIEKEFAGAANVQVIVEESLETARLLEAAAVALGITG